MKSYYLINLQLRFKWIYHHIPIFIVLFLHNIEFKY